MSVRVEGSQISIDGLYIHQLDGREEQQIERVERFIKARGLNKEEKKLALQALKGRINVVKQEREPPRGIVGKILRSIKDFFGFTGAGNIQRLKHLRKVVGSACDVAKTKKMMEAKLASYVKEINKKQKNSQLTEKGVLSTDAAYNIRSMACYEDANLKVRAKIEELEALRKLYLEQNPPVYTGL